MFKGQNNKLQKGYIRRYLLTDGKESGIKVIEIDNGILRVLLNESKGLDVMQVFHKGTNVSFVSKNGFSARDNDFSKRFEGGMLYTCGFDSIGGRDGYEIHGSYHNIPAKVVRIEESADKLTVVAQMEITSLFAENLILEREVSLLMDGENLLIEDTLINRGTKDENYCVLYHINLGYPMLDQGAKIIIDAKSVLSRTEYSEKKIANREVFEAPIDNEEERCYFIENKGNCASVVNERIKKSFSLNYSKDTLPCLVQWVSPASQDYALGIEPASSFLDDKFEYKTIKQGEKVKFFINIGVKDI